MPHPVVPVLIIFAVIAVAPFLLLRGADDASEGRHGGERLPPAPPRVLHNAAIAYALRGPLLYFAFLWGARGEFWPLLVTAGTAVFGGLMTLLLLRKPLQLFLQNPEGQSSLPTLHAFLARPYTEADAKSLRRLTACLSVLALGGLLAVEAVGLAYVLKPMLIFPAPWPDAIAGVVLALALSAVLFTGKRAAVYAAQTQLGLIYLGLFGGTAFLLYLLLAAYPPMPPYGVPALAALVMICIVLIVYRRSRYVDTSPIGLPRGGSTAFEVAETRGGKLLRRFNKVLNPLLTAILVVIVVFALMGLTAFGWDRLARDTLKVLTAPATVSLSTLIMAVLLPLLYPLVDATNWQTLSFLARHGASVEQAERELRTTVRTYAGETALMALFAGVLGAIAASATTAWRSDAPLEAFAGHITAFQNLIAQGAVALLVPGIIVAIFATMVMLAAAIFATLQQDLLEAPGSAETLDGRRAPVPARAAPRPSAPAAIVAVIVLAAFVLTEAAVPASATGTVLLAALFGFACCQLPMAPLAWRAVHTPISAHRSRLFPMLLLAAGAMLGIAAALLVLLNA